MGEKTFALFLLSWKIILIECLNETPLLNGDKIISHNIIKDKYCNTSNLVDDLPKAKNVISIKSYNTICEDGIIGEISNLQEVEVKTTKIVTHKSNSNFETKPDASVYSENWFPAFRNTKYGIGEFAFQKLSQFHGCIVTNLIIDYSDAYHKCNCTVLQKGGIRPGLIAIPCQNKFEIPKENNYDQDEPKILILEKSGDIFVMPMNIENIAAAPKTNQKVWCFTDSIPDHLYEGVSIAANFTFNVQKSGYYWCEFYHLNDYSLGRSNVLLIINENIFIMKVRMNFTSDPTSSLFAYENIKQMEINFNSRNDFINKVVLKWKKTLYLDDKIVEYLIHICTPQDNKTYLTEQKYINDNIDNFKIPAIQSISGLLNRTHCLETTTNINGRNLTWPPVSSGSQNVLPQELCFSKFGHHVTRNCLNDFFEGANWDTFNERCFEAPKSENTDDLEELLKNDTEVEEAKSQLLVITSNSNTFVSTDIYLSAKIMEKVRNDTNISEVNNVVNNLMNSQKVVLKEAQKKFNSSDIILRIMDDVYLKDKVNYTNEKFYSNKLKSFVYNAKENEIFGMALIKKESSYEIIEITREMGSFEIASIPNLEMAIYVPKKLLQDIINDSDAAIVVNAFMDSVLFQAVDDNAESITKNFGILLPSVNLVKPIQLYYRYTGESKPNCGFWNYREGVRGYWDPEMKSLVLKNNIHLCLFHHVTHFGLLVMNSKDNTYDDGAIIVLSIIGCSLSIVGAVGIFITALICKEWRENKTAEIMLNFSVTSFVQILSLFSSYYIPDEDKNSLICIITGIILHYTTISQFCWMFVFGIFQYRRYIIVWGGSSKWILVKVSTFSYLVPFIPITVLVICFDNTYEKVPRGLCYPSDEGLIYTVILPIAIIVAANIFILVRIYFEMFCWGEYSVKDDMFAEKTKLIIWLFFILGLTWAFGILAQVFKLDMFVYIFCITASAQCFIIFIFFVVLHKGMRRMYFNHYQNLKSKLLQYSV